MIRCCSRAPRTIRRCVTTRRPRFRRGWTGYASSKKSPSSFGPPPLRCPLRARSSGLGTARRRSQLLRQDHFGQTLAARHHREYVFGLIRDEIEKDQTLFLCERFTQCALDVAWLFDLHADVTVSFGELHEIRQRI